jgi:ketosteroid isomerase-like protein
MRPVRAMVDAAGAGCRYWQGMGDGNVEAFKRGVAAYNGRDVDALLDELDPELEWHPVLPVLLGGETTVYRGHEGARDLIGDVDRAFADFQIEIDEVRDLPGDRILASGRMRARGKASGAPTESPLSYVVDFRNGKVIRVRSFLDRAEALEAAGLQE